MISCAGGWTFCNSICWPCYSWNWTLLNMRTAWSCLLWEVLIAKIYQLWTSSSSTAFVEKHRFLLLSNSNITQIAGHAAKIFHGDELGCQLSWSIFLGRKTKLENCLHLRVCLCSVLPCLCSSSEIARIRSVHSFCFRMTCPETFHPDK